ncbi:MAG: type I-D CRISPR-associated protein Cas7/Csc2 [Candidatus Parvarchaeota archaeon]
MSEIGKEIMKHIGGNFFATESADGEIPALCQNNARNVTLVLIRETIAPFIDRSNIPDESIWFNISGNRNVIHIPARKFKSREKMFGIKLLRYLGMVDEDYRYNHLTAKRQMVNPTSILMGESIVFPEKGEEPISIPARALYSDVYSIRNRELITERLTNNALNEEGTMYDKDKNKTSSAFFTTEYVVPGVFFPAFITLKDPTPELLLHLIFSLRQTSYGASTATTGANFRNHIIGIVGSRIEPPVSSYLVSLKYPDLETANSGKGILFDDVKKHTLSIVKENLTEGAVLIADASLTSFLQYINSLKLDDDIVKEAYKQAKIDAEKYIRYSFGEIEPKKEKKINKNTSGSGSHGNIQA